MFGSHDTSLFPLVVSNQEIDKGLWDLFLFLRCSGLITAFTEIEIIWVKVFFSYRGGCIKERLFVGFDVLEILKIELVVVDFWDVLGVEDFVHEFFGGLLELFDEGGVLIFVICWGFEEIVLIEMGLWH